MSGAVSGFEGGGVGVRGVVGLGFWWCGGGGCSDGVDVLVGGCDEGGGGPGELVFGGWFVGLWRVMMPGMCHRFGRSVLGLARV